MRCINHTEIIDYIAQIYWELKIIFTLLINITEARTDNTLRLCCYENYSKYYITSVKRQAKELNVFAYWKKLIIDPTYTITSMLTAQMTDSFTKFSMKTCLKFFSPVATINESGTKNLCYSYYLDLNKIF